MTNEAGKLELIVSTARKYLDGDASRDTFEAALEDAYDEAATIAELRERLAALASNDANDIVLIALARDEAEARATAAERALVERGAQVADLKDAWTAARKTLPPDPNLNAPWSQAIAIMDEAVDALPASATSAARVLTAAVGLQKKRRGVGGANNNGPKFYGVDVECESWREFDAAATEYMKATGRE